MDEQIVKRTERAQVLVNSVGNAAMATVNVDDSPHNTPLFIAFSPDFETVYWISTPESLHSQNVSRNKQAYFALYAADAGGGLYFPAHNIRVTDGEELATGLTAYNLARARQGHKQPLLLTALNPPSPQRLYAATVTHYSVNVAEKDEQGRIVRDYRYEISRQQLAASAEDAVMY